MPSYLLQGEIRPTIKNKLGNKNSSDNYRPVMNSSNLLKLFEYCILPVMSRHMKLSDRQFGFRTGTGCNMAISIFKENILNYNSSGSNVHCSVLDMSSAFDRINYNTCLLYTSDAADE